MSARRNHVTALKRRRRRGDAMAAFDAAPPPLRHWLAGAQLSWSVEGATRRWQRLMKATKGDEAAALAALSAHEAALVSRDAALVWGKAHPAARGCQP